MSIFTEHLSASHGAQVTGSLRLTDSNVTGEPNHLNFVRDDTSIFSGDNLGKVIFSGRDGGPAVPGQDFIIGAAIAATASATWGSNYTQSTDLKFWVQTNVNTVDQLAEGAILTLSGTNKRAGFIGDVWAGSDVYAKGKLQAGVSTDGNVADNAGYPFRFSAATGDVGIEIDAGSASDTASVLFNAGGASATSKFGIFVQQSSGADFSIRKHGTAQENGAVMINNNANSVRIGGGGFGTDAYDPQAALVVSASEANRNSWVMLRSRHDTVTTDNAPILTLDFKSNTGNANTGAWHMGVSPHGTKPLRITAASVGSSVIQDNTVAMTFNSAGSSTSIGVGGTGTWPAAVLPRSQDPTGSFHIEHMNTATDQLTSNLTKTNLLLGNSAAGGSTVYSQLAFDVSTALTPNKHTANITVSKKQSTDTGHMSFRMYDESGNDNSTRPRVRIDGQGGIIMLSGSTSVAGAGWPMVNNSNYLVGTKMPSGSLTLVANKPGAVWSPPTLNLVTWGSSTHSNPAISAGDSLGRIQWWSSDSDLTSESERVGAYIEAHATSTHSAANKSPTKISFFARGVSAAEPTARVEITSGMTTFADSIEVAGTAQIFGPVITGDLTVTGNKIKDNSTGIAITFDGAANTTITGELTLGDNVINASDGTTAVTVADTTGDVTTSGKLLTDFVRSKTTNMTVEAVGDIILSAPGNQIQMDDGTTWRYRFNVDSTPSIEANGSFILAGNDTVDINSGTGSDLTLDAGGDIILDAVGTTSVTGRLNFAEYGRLVSGIDLGTDGEWIKVATRYGGANSQAGSSVAIQVTMVGRQNFITSAAQCLKQATIYLAHETDGGASGMGSPGFFVDIVSALPEAGFGGSDSSWTKDDFILTYDTSSPFAAEIWVKAEGNASVTNLEAYASIIGGSTSEHNNTYVDYWKLNTSQTWAANAADLGTQVTAEYPNRPVGYLYSEGGITVGKAHSDSSDRYVKVKVGSNEKAGITMTETTVGSGTGELGTDAVYGFEMRYDGTTNDLEFVRGEQTTLNTCLRITRSAGHIYALDTAGNTDSGTANMHIDTTTGEIHRSTSDRRGKKEISELTSSLDDICKLIPRQFYDIKDENNENLIPGFVSDEVESAIPLLVPDRDISDPEVFRSVSYDRVCVYIINALKEIKQRLDDLESNS